MKTLVSVVVALGLAVGAAAPAFAAAAPTNKADCLKSKGTWDDTAKKCTPAKM